MNLNVVLIEPEIPQNTGNIGRTCAVVGATLHLVKPFGFSIEDKYLKRAGLDYWHLLDVRYYENSEEFFVLNREEDFIFVSTKAQKNYCQVTYRDNVFLVFGKETKGLPADLIKTNLSRSVRIPMIKEARSLNLATSVAVVVYEALRQNNFEHMALTGKLSI
jgi:tRNA (cytidine/uridine-2'-O-)-methyltransferase